MSKLKTLVEIGRKTFGHDACAINRHNERKYRDQAGNLYVLSRTLDGCPPFFEAYGPYKPEHQGVLPRFRVMNKEYWGDGWAWSVAIKAFCRELHATIRKE
jgi:hypothetical protein